MSKVAPVSKRKSIDWPPTVINTRGSSCGAAGAGAGRRLGLGFRFPVKWWDSLPPLGDLEPANQYTPSKKPARELKSPREPKFEQNPAPFVPTELLLFKLKAILLVQTARAFVQT